MPRHEALNGVDVGRLNDTLEDIRQDPSIARFQLRARNEWVDGAHCRTTIQEFWGANEERSHERPHVLEADEPDILLGQDQGPGAAEAALYALASCLNTTLIYHAAAKGIQIDELELELEGDIDLQGFLGLSPEVRNGFQEVRVTMRVKSEAPQKQIEELCELAQRRSPVFDIVTHATPVKVQLEAIQPVAS
jgi:uncharacterized OsmC-like protein